MMMMVMMLWILLYPRRHPITAVMMMLPNMMYTVTNGMLCIVVDHFVTVVSSCLFSPPNVFSPVSVVHVLSTHATLHYVAIQSPVNVYALHVQSPCVLCIHTHTHTHKAHTHKARTKHILHLPVTAHHAATMPT